MNHFQPKCEEHKGILLLSHCGYSFLEDLVAITKSIGRECYILSSLPEKNERITELEALGNWSRITKEKALHLNDVQQALAVLTSSGKEIEACISVWEGYRDYMAWANNSLGIADLSCESIETLTDKYALRLQLSACRLSEVKTQILTKEVLEQAKNNSPKKFIKPRKGLASYGAFSLQDSTTWEDIEKIKREVIHDHEYTTWIAKEEVDFIMEDYIPGQEYSFEIICVEGKCHILAIHEKVDVTEKAGTVHEGACISPSITLDKLAIQQAEQWIYRIFETLQLDWGCFHLEAKCYQGQWEVIEINPRVGGAYISQSVATLIEGESLLALWLKSLVLQQDKKSYQALKHLLHQQSMQGELFWKRKNGVFFRVYFAEPGKVINNISMPSLLPSPYLKKVFLTENSRIPVRSREIFLAQFLWKIPQEQLKELSSPLIKNSQDYLEVNYE